ncbi:MAG TPA: homoserine dehydrogenase [Thermodesulfobacteriota bacterium]|nr:homoserine dehydrogenase [Thermodesulfobacteriota bacterium]
MNTVHIGLLGFGTVGQGTVRILTEKAALLESRLGARLAVRRIAVRDPAKRRDLAVDPRLLTADPLAVVDDPRIAVVVELMGGIEPARTLLLRAIGNGKAVVTANKALLARHGPELYRAAAEAGVDLGFEAAVAGGIPLIRSVKEGLVAARIEALYGIINGTSNYILTKMSEEGASFADALAAAQARGYAEADPEMDVSGADAAHKLAILVALAFGHPIDVEQVYTEGMARVTPLDLRFARQFGYRVKLLAIAKQDADDAIEARVHPTMIPAEHPLAAVGGVFNAVYLKGDTTGPVLLYGRGAGALPTGSAVVSDLVDTARNLLAGAAHRVPPLGYQMAAVTPRVVRPMEEVVTRYYFRFHVVDRPGVLSRISGVLGAHDVSIASMVQEGREAAGAVPIVMMTHEAREADVRAALTEIDRLPIVQEPSLCIRVEDQLA